MNATDAKITQKNYLISHFSQIAYKILESVLVAAYISANVRCNSERHLNQYWGGQFVAKLSEEAPTEQRSPSGLGQLSLATIDRCKVELTTPNQRRSRTARYILFGRVSKPLFGFTTADNSRKRRRFYEHRNSPWFSRPLMPKLLKSKCRRGHAINDLPRRYLTSFRYGEVVIPRHPANAGTMDPASKATIAKGR